MKKKVMTLLILSGLIISMSGCTTINSSDSTAELETTVIEQTGSNEQTQQDNVAETTSEAATTTADISASFDSVAELNELNSFLEKETFLWAVLMGIKPYAKDSSYESLQNQDGSYIGVDIFASGMARYTFAKGHINMLLDNYPVYTADIDAGSAYGAMDALEFVSYDDYNKEYKKYFGTDYDISTGISAIQYNNDYYDNSKQAQDYTAKNYVLLNGYTDGMNGVKLIDKPNALSYDESTGVYTATMDTTLNDRDTQLAAFTSELKYTKVDGNIILKSYTITADK